MTMLKIDKTWLYCFGGQQDHVNRLEKKLNIERFNTINAGQSNLESSSWEEIDIETGYDRACQQGVVLLPKQVNDNERRYLIFGGLSNRFLD